MNIVIADDEQIILKWMKKNIEELAPDYHVLSICRNGKQVLNCCLNQQVDVLFTDIRMPIMGGIELLQRLVDNQVLPYTIILSAHDDFSYARDCFKLGVSEFLLKSEITKEKLEKCLKIAKSHMQNIKPAAPSKDKQWEEAVGQYFRYISNNQKKEDSPPVDIGHQWEAMCEIEGDFLVMKISGCLEFFHAGRFQELAAFLFQEEEIRFYCISGAEGELVILSECPHESIRRFADRVYQTLSSFGYADIRISASGRGRTWEDLEQVYLQAEEVSAFQSFYLQYGKADYITMREQQDEALRNLEQAFKELKEQSASRHCEEEILELKKLFCLVKTARPEVSAARQYILNYLFHIYWNYLAEERRTDIFVSGFMELSGCPDIGALEKKVTKQIEQLSAMLKEKQDSYSESVYEMIRYMEEHFEESISLEELANHVHMNRSYISHLFKKETGINIYQYLLEFRLEKAKLLLLDGRCSVQQVCRQAGIPDSAYFSKLFKKHVGMSPLEFRKTRKTL